MFRMKVIMPYENYDSEVFDFLSQHNFSIYWQNIHTSDIDYAISHDDMWQYQAICIYNGESDPYEAIKLLTNKGISYSIEKK